MPQKKDISPILAALTEGIGPDLGSATRRSYREQSERLQAKASYRKLSSGRLKRGHVITFVVNNKGSLGRGLLALKKDAKLIATDTKSAEWKVMLATLLKQKTSATNA